MENNDDSLRDVLVDVQNVSKKYCRRLHPSLRYGVSDLIREGLGMSASSKLRPGEFFAVKNASFQVRRGEAVQLMGPNGAGKSTMMKMLNGILKPNTGRIRMKGRFAALTSLGAGFNPILSGRENIYINGAVLGFSREQISDSFSDITDFSEIEYAIDDPVKTYSSGMKARLGYSIAVNLKPDLLLMDEVLAAGDRRFRAKCFAHLESIVAEGTAIVLVSHIGGSRLAKICSRAIVFDRGITEFDGDYLEGFSLYERLLNDEKSKAWGNDDISSTSDAWIQAIELFDQQGRAVESVREGSCIRMRIRLMAKTRIKRSRLFVSFEKSSGGSITSLKTRFGDFELDEQGKAIELTIPSLSLQAGTYFINVDLVGPKSVIYDMRRGACLLELESSSTREESMDHHWNFDLK